MQFVPFEVLNKFKQTDDENVIDGKPVAENLNEAAHEDEAVAAQSEVDNLKKVSMSCHNLPLRIIGIISHIVL